MGEHRSRLVRAFRAIGNPQRPKSLRIPVNELLREAQADVGNIPVQDCHSILVAFAKLFKLPHRDTLGNSHCNSSLIPHPVTVAPLASSLIARIVSSDAPFQTIAGTFGLVHRLGIDWSRHLTVEDREKFVRDIQSRFPAIVEQLLVAHSLAEKDITGLGYCCEAASHFGVTSPEFQQLVETVVSETSNPIPPLSVVQLLHFFSMSESPNPRAVSRLLDQVAFGIEKYSPQNLVQILGAMRSLAISSDQKVLESIGDRLSRNCGQMRFEDCVTALNCMAQLTCNSNSSLTDFARSMQRRCTVLVVTSAKPLPLTMTYTIMSSFNKIAQISGSVVTTPAIPFIHTQLIAS